MRRQSTVTIVAKKPRVTPEQLEEDARKQQEVEEALRLVWDMNKLNPLELLQLEKDKSSGPNSPEKTETLKKFKKVVKNIQKIQKVNKGMKGLVEERRSAQQSKREMDEKAIREAEAVEKRKSNQFDEEDQLARFDCVLESEARVAELFQALEEDDGLDDDDGYGESLGAVTDVKETSYDLKLDHQQIEDILESMGAMKFQDELVAKDSNIENILDQKDDFIEEAFKSRVNESRHIQQMYDKFRRYRKHEEEKLQHRLREVRRTGSVEGLEEKLVERTAQLTRLGREVAQKEKFYKLIRESTQASSINQIRAMLELSAQDEVERMMKVLESQQGDVLRLLMNLDKLHKEYTKMRDEVSTQMAVIAGDDEDSLEIIAKATKCQSEVFKMRSKLNNEEQEKTRLTATVSKALKTILATALTNDSAQANLARLQQESPELDEAKQVEVKVKNIKAEVDEIMEKKKTLEEEEARLNEIERKFKENDEKESEKQKRRSGKRGLHAEEVSGTAHVASEAGSDRTAALEEVFAKALTVDKGVRLFMDKEEAIEQDAAAALQGWGENEGEGGGEMPSIDDIALSHDNVNFAIKLGYKGKDQKAQDKMKLAQGVDQAVFEKQKLKYKSYGLNAVLDQIEGIFKLLYIDPDIMQVAAESSDDEDDDSDIKHELKSFDYNEIRRSSMVNVDENNADYLKNRLKRQETREVVMNDEFERKYAKQPILNMRYEDIFRNKKFDVEGKLENPSGSGSVGSSVVEFDPSARREEVYSVVEPGDEDDLLMRLGVDGEGNIARSKESQRKDLFIAHLQMELFDCNKVTKELSRRKAVNGKVDTNVSRSEASIEVVDRDLQSEFPDIIHESPSCELGVDVYRTCETLASAIVRRRSSIADVKKFIGKVETKKKRTLEILAEKTESRDYAYDTFTRNLKKLETVQKKSFKLKSEIDIEKSERLRSRLEEEIGSWKNNLKTLVAGTEFDIIEEISEPVVEALEQDEEVSEQVDKISEQVDDASVQETRNVEGESRTLIQEKCDSEFSEGRSLRATRSTAGDIKDNLDLDLTPHQSRVQLNEICEINRVEISPKLVSGITSDVELLSVPLNDSATLSATNRPQPSFGVDPSVEPNVEPSVEPSVDPSVSVNLTSDSRLNQTSNDRPDIVIGMSDSGEELIVQDVAQVITHQRKEQSLPPLEIGSVVTAKSEKSIEVRSTHHDNNQPLTTLPTEQKSSEKVFADASVNEERSAFSVTTSNSVSTTNTGLEGRSVKEGMHEAVRVMLFESQPFQVVPPSRPPIEDAPGSRATSSRMRRFRYSEELSGVTKDALDNTPITPVAYDESPDAMVCLPHGDRVSPVGKQQGSELKDVFQQLDSNEFHDEQPVGETYNRLNSPRTGSGPYTPVPHVNVRELQPAGLGDDLFSETSDLGIPNKPLVTNYFVPKSMLKRTTKLVSQIQRWKKVAKDGGIFQNDNKVPQNSGLAHDSMFIVGGGNNTSQQDLGNGLPPAISESQHGANSYWTEATENSVGKTPIGMKFDDMTDSLSTFNDTTKRLRDPNSDVFPMPKVKKESLSDKVFASNDINKKDVAIEKAIVTRKILRVSAWDRVVGMKTSFMKKYIQQELRDPRVVRVINAFTAIKRKDQYQDKFDYVDSSQDMVVERISSGIDDTRIDTHAVGEKAFADETENDKSKVKESKTLLRVLRRRVHQIIEAEREKLLNEKTEKERKAANAAKKKLAAARQVVGNTLLDMSTVDEEDMSDENDDSEGDEVVHMSGMSHFKFSVDVSRSSSAISRKYDDPPKPVLKPPPSKYYLDESSSQETPPGDIQKDSLDDSVSLEPTVGSGSTTLEDMYSNVLTSAVYNLFDQQIDKKSSQNPTDVVPGNTGTAPSHINESDIESTTLVRTNSHTTDDGIALIAPPSPVVRDPPQEHLSKHGRSLISIGSSALPRFKLEDEKVAATTTIPAIDSKTPQLATSTALPLFPPDKQQQQSSTPQVPTPAAFPYQPPSALKSSSTLQSPRHKSSKANTKVLFTKDLLKKT